MVREKEGAEGREDRERGGRLESRGLRVPSYATVAVTYAVAVGCFS